MSSGKEVNCVVCDKRIEEFARELNHLVIDETHSVDICQDCLKKIVKWQQGIYAKLFPTKMSKRMLDRRDGGDAAGGGR